MSLRSSNRHETFGENGEKRLENVTPAGKSRGAALRRSDIWQKNARLRGHLHILAAPENRLPGRVSDYIGVTRVGPAPLITWTRWPTLMGTSASCATTRVSPLSRRTVIS